ncbi:hypothetical protein [Halomicrobium sp. LC1Hm]|uniref:DUF7527 domain-containing protein n=1 Tax=Halomicrobium sp. LC1Hm TaxID=2610902 RepID=UPI001298456C|nr:hypothetical protein [Halomicrobium sp. LC1Hm]QGA82699.1 Uncharacterized protein LC1Hm_1654 [Halomicrobium sp. LC1Hm]
MSTRTVEQIDSWDTVPFSGGYEGLHELADSEFSGVVVAGPSRLFMLNGNVVGILDGSIEDFEDAGGTARKAPHHGLPLLAVMQERSDEVRAKYYTEDTPIAEVDQTLSSGGFTGFVELSENVLSGDYYQIYHQGRSMSVAWVGNSDQLVTEDEAFEQANDEVGIYEVRPVDIEIVDVPEPTTPEPASSEETAGVSGEAPGDAAPADEATSESTTSPDPDTPDEPAASGDAAPADATTGDDGGEPAGHGGDARSDPVAKTGTETTRQREADADAREQTEPRTSEPSSPTDQQTDTTSDSASPSSESRAPEQSPPDRTPTSESPDGQQRPRDRRQSDQTPAGDSSEEPTRREQEPRNQPATDRPAGENATRASSESVDPQPTDGVSAEPEAGRQPEPVDQSESGAGVAPAPNDPSAAGAGDLETRSIPSLDPSHSGTASAAAAADESSDSAPPTGVNGGVESDPEPERSQSRHPGAPADQQSATAEPESDRKREPERSAEATERRQSQSRDGPERQSTGRADQQSADSPERQPAQPTDDPEPEPTDATEPHAERVAELEQALEETEAERDQLQSELEEARTEIERLEQRVEELSVEDDDVPAAETRLSQREAIDQTNLFVRYNSKGDATLAAVHSGNADRSAVDDNLRLEFHTQFDAETAAVGDTEFETFLPESIQYRFVDWLVRNLLYEIRDTGNPEAMSELFDALPQIDRAELNGQIAVEYTEDGEQHRSQEQFDVVVRDRMGNPLIVANINDSRDPATDDMMTDLITRAERVGSSNESLAGAFLVTESFFEPPALETAEEATSSGLLSRDKRKSFVNLSRKDGYHLCLVEARNQEFHLAVPEL